MCRSNNPSAGTALLVCCRYGKPELLQNAHKNRLSVLIIAFAPIFAPAESFLLLLMGIDQLLLVVFLGALAVRSGYDLFLFLRLALYRRPPAPNLPPTGSRGVSLVVCAHDEEENLKQLLPLLYAQAYQPLEIIVVNDRSNDGTYDLLLAEADKEPRLKPIQIDRVPEHINGKKFGLTMAMKAAMYDLVVLTDADCRPASNQWVRHMAQAFDSQQTNIVLGYSPYKKRRGLLNQFIRFETLFTGIQYLSMAIAGKPYMGVGRNMAYRKSLFMKVKGFNKFLELTGGDDDLFVNKYGNRQNTQIAIGHESVVFSVPKTKFIAYFRQKKRHLHIGKYYRPGSRFNLGVLVFSHILFWICFTILAIKGTEPYMIVGGLMVRIVIMYAVFVPAAKKMGDRLNVWLLPLMDMIYALYYLVFGSITLLSKRVRWI